MTRSTQLGILFSILALMFGGLIFASTLYIVQRQQVSIREENLGKAQTLYASQIAACERGNIIRATIHNNAGVSREFFRRAAQARDASAARSTEVAARQDAAAAEAYRQYATRLRQPGQIPCNNIIPRP